MTARSPFRRPTRTTLVTGLVAGPLALALVACGSSDSDGDDAAPAASETTTSSAPATTSSSEAASEPATAPSSAPASDPAPAGGQRVLLAAATTALGATDGTIFSVDLDTTGWDVQVVAADGTESEVLVSADGASVAGGPTVDPDDADDADDVAERQRLLTDATVDYRAALQAALAEVPGGTVTSLDLDTDNGVPTWDVQLDEDTVDERTVTLDAVTGAVLRVELDD